jgi:hypothetical protein
MTMPNRTQDAWSPAYNVLTLDLATVRTAERVVPVGEFYTSVYVKQLALGSAASIAIGANRPFIPLVEGETYELTDECGNPRACTEGLFVANPAGAGSLILVIGYQGGIGVSR